MKPQIGMKLKPTSKEWIHVILVAIAVVVIVLLLEGGSK